MIISDIIIRPYDPKDYEDIKAISKNIWEGQDYLPKLINKYYESKYCYPYVVEVNKKVISVVNTHFFTQEWVWLEAIRTHPDFQGKGLASRLSEYQMKKIIELGGKQAWLLTSTENKVTYKMLTNFNFSEFQQIKAWVSNNNLLDEKRKADLNGLVDGKLVDINYLKLNISSYIIKLSEKWKAIQTVDELKQLISIKNSNSEFKYLFSEFMIFPVNSYFVPEWISNRVIFQLNQSSIMIFQPSKERENRYVISINDPDPNIILSALFYGYQSIYNHFVDKEPNSSEVNIIIFYPSEVVIPILENCKYFRIMQKQL